MKILCINDKDKPLEIPEKKWIEEGREYELIFIAWCIPQKSQGFSLAEIELDESCSPYEYFRGDRFGIKKEDLEEFLQLAKDCTDMNDLSIEELLKETEIELI